MSKKSIYGIFAVIIVLGALLVLSQRYLGGSGVSDSPNAPGQPGPSKMGPPSQITADKLRQHWKELIGSAPPPRGPANAPYQVVEIGDFQCPICGKLKPFLAAIMQASDGKAKLYFVNWPLTRIHAHAMDAAEAGDAAAAQGKFWQMYDLLYSDQNDLQAAFIQASARAEPGINATQLASDMNSHKFKPAIEEQTKLVMAIGAEATPTFLVRSPNGSFSWYVGRIGTQGDKGIKVLAKRPPWGGGMSDAQIDSLTADPDAQP